MLTDLGLAIGSTAAVIVAAIIKVPFKRNGGISRDACDERHRNLDANIADIKGNIGRIFEILEERKR